MPDEHQRFRELLGAHALDPGSLDASERAELESHLGACASCRREEAELRAVVSILEEAGARYRAGLEESPISEEPSPELEDRIAAAVFPERGNRRRRKFVAGLAVAAALLAGAVGLGIFFSAPQGPPGLGEEEPIAFVGEPAGVSEEAFLVAHTWGTEVVLEVEGLEPGEVYAVDLRREDGDTASAGTFVGVEDAPVECRLNGAVLRQDVRAVAIKDSEGRVVMRTDLEPRPDLEARAGPRLYPRRLGA
ncbi:MAG: zf-HC2 domain-containing protein [Rubrobacteraceae bacterium]